MGTQVGIGISHHRNPIAAAQEAVDKALQHGQFQRPDFVIMFSTVGYRQAVLLKAVRAATHQVPLVGCSGAGVITEGKADESNFSIVLMAIQSDEIRLQYGLAEGLQKSSAAAGQRIGTEVRSQLQPDAAVLFLFTDGITFNFADFIRGLGEFPMLDHPLPVVGGLAGDNFVYEKTYQYCDDQVISNGAAWAVLSGNLKMVSAISHGCVPMGNYRTITKCDRNIIYEIDNRPVLEFLKDYLNEAEIQNWDTGAANLGLAFPASPDASPDTPCFIRCIIGKDDLTASVTLQTEVHEGDKFWLTRRNFDKIRNGIDQMTGYIIKQLEGNTPKFIFQVECDGRGKTIFREKEKLELLTRLQSTLGPKIPWIGFYSFGEIGPIGAENCIHNFTSVVSAFY